jgi:hypothetical protein
MGVLDGVNARDMPTKPISARGMRLSTVGGTRQHSWIIGVICQLAFSVLHILEFVESCKVWKPRWLHEPVIIVKSLSMFWRQ